MQKPLFIIAILCITFQRVFAGDTLDNEMTAPSLIAVEGVWSSLTEASIFAKPGEEIPVPDRFGTNSPIGTFTLFPSTSQDPRFIIAYPVEESSLYMPSNTNVSTKQENK